MTGEGVLQDALLSNKERDRGRMQRRTLLQGQSRRGGACREGLAYVVNTCCPAKTFCAFAGLLFGAWK